MGIGQFTADYLTQFFVEQGLGGSILTLGRQTIHMDLKCLIDQMGKHGLVQFADDQIFFPNEEKKNKFLELASSPAGIGLPSETGMQAISDTLYFQSVGFDLVESTDSVPFENATYVHDLNCVGLIEKTNMEYDFIYDGGTTEHIFHQPNIFNNIFHVTKIGGHVFHQSGVNNYVNHGFYQFSPTFYFDWYHVNKWKIVRKHLVRHTVNSFTEPYKYFEIEPNGFDHLCGGLDDAMYVIFFCAQKTAESTWDVIPHQGRYRDAWRGYIASQP